MSIFYIAFDKCRFIKRGLLNKKGRGAGMMLNGFTLTKGSKQS